jgi:hypothetical protein
MDYQAYWVTPRNRLIPVPFRHIIAVNENPALFGLTRGYVDREFRKFKEQNGVEGYAREVILARVIRAGWIRLRYEPRDYILTVQLSGTRDIRRRSRALRIAKRVCDGRIFPRDISVKLVGLKDGDVEMLDPEQLRVAMRKPRSQRKMS